MWRLAAFLIPFLTHSALSGDVGRLYWVSPLFCVFDSISAYIVFMRFLFSFVKRFFLFL